MSERFGFSILNYNSFIETKKCIESILRCCDNAEYRIVIVDNASPDGSGESLFNLYSDNPRIHVILNDNNSGFAIGNNYGFRYLKKLGCDFIFLLNSDVELMEGFSLQKIEEYYNDHHFAAMGPRIITNSYSSGKCNPVRLEPLSIHELRITYVKLLVRLILWEIGIGRFISYDGNKKRINRCKIDYDQIHENVELHGCCLVFSKEFICKKEGLNEVTFMYGEEDILYYELLLEELKTIYIPDVCVFHYEKKSTENSFSNIRKKKIFELKNRVKSMQHVIGIAENYWKKMIKE